jgi:hypothetical protein
MNEGQIFAIIALVILLLIALVIREFWTWFWKINRMVELLVSIDRSLKALPAVQQMQKDAL